VPPAPNVVGVVSPDDDSCDTSFDLPPATPAAASEEIVVADPGRKTVALWSLTGLAYRRVTSSALLGVSDDEITRGSHGP